MIFSAAVYFHTVVRQLVTMLFHFSNFIDEFTTMNL